MNSDTNVSILIRTKNEDKYIGKTLDILFSQTYKDIEVLIVDSGSTDKTLEIAKKYPVKIYKIRPEDFTWGYALNYGFQRSKGKYVVNLSAHAMPLSADWLETLLANFSDDKVAAVMSNNLPCPYCNPFDRRGLLKKFNIPKQEIEGGPPYIFGNFSAVVRKSVWEIVPYDETLTYAEDHDWALKIVKLGFRIIFEPEAKVYHSHNETLKQIYSRSYKEAIALTELEFKKFTLINILIDLCVGSVYDMLYVLVKGDNLKWFVFAPLRRFVMNYARLKASRTVYKNKKGLG